VEPLPIDFPEKHKAFLASPRKHILMITNHGVHQWKIIPGLPDTGGQNVFVNQFTESLARLGFKITIVNRGGYPHPTTGEIHRGLHYKDEHQRILYIEDSKKQFIRKEDMGSQIGELVGFLKSRLDKEGSHIDLIISHYWDAAKVGIELNKKLPQKLPHVWVPHSLGAVKKRNMPESDWANLRVDERIAIEREMVPQLDGIGATSSVIKNALKNDYDHDSKIFLPPCVDTNRYYKEELKIDHPIWKFLGEKSGLSIDEIRNSKIITEISRTDKTKRKDVLIKAFGKALKTYPESFLIVSIDEKHKLANELDKVIQDSSLGNRIAVVGSVWDILPHLYQVTDIYCSPSVMEGFGMSVQEAAATEVPVVGSHLIPFVEEYLLGANPKLVTYNEKVAPLRLGEGGMIIQADDIEGFAFGLKLLLKDGSLRKKMGENAFRITVPYFTWDHMVKDFLEKIDFKS